MKDVIDIFSNSTNIDLIFQFFIPGFISLIISGAVGPTPDADFAKRTTMALGYSALNFAAMSAAIGVCDGLHLQPSGIFHTGIRVIFIFVLPLFYPYIIFWMREKQAFGFSTPFPSTWDQFFARRNKTYFVRALLKGSPETYVLGYYGKTSLASQSPAEQMLFLEAVYDVDDSGDWYPRRDNASILLPMSECRSIEFLIPEGS